MTYLDIIEALGGPKALAADLGIPSVNTVVYWGRPGRTIPPHRWKAITDLPAAKKQGITLELLASARASKALVA